MKCSWEVRWRNLLCARQESTQRRQAAAAAFIGNHTSTCRTGTAGPSPGQTCRIYTTSTLNLAQLDWCAALLLVSVVLVLPTYWYLCPSIDWKSTQMCFAYVRFCIWQACLSALLTTRSRCYLEMEKMWGEWAWGVLSACTSDRLVSSPAFTWHLTWHNKKQNGPQCGNGAWGEKITATPSWAHARIWLFDKPNNCLCSLGLTWWTCSGSFRWTK